MQAPGPSLHSFLVSAYCRQLSSPNFTSLSSLVETLKYVGALLQEAGVNVELSVVQHLRQFLLVFCAVQQLLIGGV